MRVSKHDGGYQKPVRSPAAMAINSTNAPKTISASESLGIRASFGRPCSLH